MPRITDLGTALKQADILAFLVNHHAFGRVDRELLKGKVVLDSPGIWR